MPSASMSNDARERSNPPLAAVAGGGMALLIENDPRDRGLGPDGDPPQSGNQPARSEGASVSEAIRFFTGIGEEEKLARPLAVLAEVGLGYLRLGQPLNTLSGGESQRLKLVRHLAETEDGKSESGSGLAKSSLFIFDEPTTGLHFDDVALLVRVFQRLVDAGNTIVVIEHNLEVMKCADWIIDLGPEAGGKGGQLVAQGAPEQVAVSPQSHTGRALRENALLQREKP